MHCDSITAIIYPCESLYLCICVTEAKCGIEDHQCLSLIFQMFADTANAVTDEQSVYLTVVTPPCLCSLATTT